MAEPARSVPDGIYRDDVTGASVHVINGKVQLKRGGKLYETTPDKAGTELARGGFEAATAADLAEHEQAKKPLGTKIKEGAKTFAEHAISGAVTAPTAVTRGLGAAGEALANEVYQTEQRRPGEVVPGTGPSITEANEENLTGMLAEGALGKEGAAEYIRERAQRSAAHPYAAIGGELLGQTAGASAALGGAAAGGSRAGRIAAAGLEGAGFGGAAASEDAHIHNKPLTAEQVVAAMGPMALLGLGTAAVAEGASAALAARSRGAELAFEETPGAAAALTVPEKSGNPVANVLRDFSNERTMKALGFKGSSLKRLGRTGEAIEERIEQIPEELHNTTLANGEKVFSAKALTSDEHLLSNIRQGETEAQEALGSYRKRIYAAEKTHPELGPDMPALFDKIESDVLQPLRASDVAGVRAKAALIEEQLNALKDIATAHGFLEGKAPPLERLQKFRQDLASEIYPKYQGKGLPPQPSANAAATELIPVERMLEKEIEATTDRIAAASFKGTEEKGYLAAKSKYRAFLQARQNMEGAVIQDIGNRVVSPTDYLTGIAGSALGGNPLAGIATAAAHKVIREHSSAVLAVVTRKLADTLDGRISSAISKAIRAPKPAIAPEVAARQIIERGGVARRAATAALSSFTAMSRQEFAHHAEELHRASDPMVSIPRTARALEPLHLHAPQTAGLAGETTQRAIAYLNSKLPASPAAQVSPFAKGASAREPAVSDEELHKFATAWRAVEDPLSIISEMETGSLTQEHVDAVKAVYPALFAQIQTKAYEALARAKEPPPYDVALQLDLMLGLNGAGEPSLTPATQSLLLQLGAQQAQSTTPPRGGSKPPNLAGRTQTLGAKLEGAGNG